MGTSVGLFRLMGLMPLQPGEQRVIESRTTPMKLSDHHANLLYDNLVAQIRRERYELVEGPKIFREIVSDDGAQAHVVTAAAIVRPPKPEAVEPAR